MAFFAAFSSGRVEFGGWGELICYLLSAYKAVVFKNSLDRVYSLHMRSESVPNQNWIHARKESRGLDICKVLDGMGDKGKTLLFITHLGYFLAIHGHPNFQTKITASEDGHLHILRCTETLFGLRRTNLT